MRFTPRDTPPPSIIARIVRDPARGAAFGTRHSHTRDGLRQDASNKLPRGRMSPAFVPNVHYGIGIEGRACSKHSPAVPENPAVAHGRRGASAERTLIRAAPHRLI